jgi:hypothetical protein
MMARLMKYSNFESFKELNEKYQNASKRFYPSVPEPPVPATLPLQNYTGTYNNPGYHNITLSLKDDHLYFDRNDHAWKVSFDLTHVSGDHFLAYMDSLTAPGLIFKTASPAEFRVGGDGISRSLGILIEPSMGLESRIWFDRI